MGQINQVVIPEQSQLSNCAICGSREFRFLFKCQDYTQFCPQELNLMECLQCGMACINPPPKKNYDYFDSNSLEVAGKTDIFDFLCPDRVKIVERIKKPGRILDIGCGRGEFLFNMQKKGWEVFGSELSVRLCNSIKAKFSLENIYCGDFLSLNLPDNFFDAITLWHVLEHFEDPVAALKKINRSLKDDGVLIIESPDFASCQRKFFKDKWFALGVPRHVHLFDPSSLKAVLRKINLQPFKKDYFVNSRVDFITIKRSALRWLGLERVPDEKGNNESIFLTGLKKYGPLYKLLRVAFEAGCLVISLFLSLINCGSCFRLYCKKAL